jgi:hypothetical protein
VSTTADLIQETRGYVYGSERQQHNALSAPVNVDDTTITLVYPNQNVAVGQTVSVGLEVLYIWAWNPASLQLTVQRGYNGSPQSVHSVADLVTVNPRFTDFEILKALNADLQDLSSPMNGLYQIVPIQLEAQSAREGYDFPVSGYQSVADIRWQVPNTETQEWREITDYYVIENLPATGTDFTSGTALFLKGDLPVPQQPIQVQYRADLGLLANLDDDVGETTGLLASAWDLPAMGAALRVMAGRPIARAQYTSQGDTRRAAEVSVSDVVNAPQALRQLRQSRVAAESARLSQLWPFRLRSRDVMRSARQI